MPGNLESLHYAFGGGLGHLTRTLALRHTLGLKGPVATLCSSPFASLSRFKPALNPCIAPPSLESSPALFRNWLIEKLSQLRPRAIYVDVFPGGILGELCDFPWPSGMEKILVARILKWQDYSSRLSGPHPRFDRILITEDLPQAQLAWLKTISNAWDFLELKDPPAEPHPQELAAIQARWKETGKPIWLIVHSGPDSETTELFEYAQTCAASEAIRPLFVVISPANPIGIRNGHEWLGVHPASSLFPFVDRIFTAGGFNSMRETAAWKAKHQPLPFPRKFDDQFLRVSQRAHFIQPAIAGSPSER